MSSLNCEKNTRRPPEDKQACRELKCYCASVCPNLPCQNALAEVHLAGYFHYISNKLEMSSLPTAGSATFLARCGGFVYNLCEISDFIEI